MTAPWIAILIISLVLSKVLSIVADHLEHLPARSNVNPRTGDVVRFQAWESGSNKLISEVDLLGFPATLLLIRVSDQESVRPADRIAAVAQISMKRSFGRMWILCDGSAAACSACLDDLPLTVRMNTTVAYGVRGDIVGLLESSKPEAVVNVDSRGILLSYGQRGSPKYIPPPQYSMEHLG